MSIVLLFLAAALWVGAHVGIAGSGLRALVVGKLGEGGFAGAFSVLSLAILIGLILAYRHAPLLPLWVCPVWLAWVLVGLMLPAFVFFVASVAGPNPTSAGQSGLMGKTVAGIQRVTRHPMLWSFAIWAGVHLAANGDAASLLFFGAFLVTALAGMPSIDRKLARRDPYGWATLAAATSIVPFGAILARRNRLAVREIPWFVPAGGAGLWVLILVVHPWVFGVPALPGWILR